MRQPPMLFRSLPALILAVGVGLTGYYGQKLYDLPTYSEAEIDSAVELNLQLDLKRRGPNLQPSAEDLTRMRQMIRKEVEANIRQEGDTVRLRFGLGLLALIVGAGHLLSQRLMQRS